MQQSKRYMKAVIETIVKKYGVPKSEARKIFKKSFVYDSLKKYPEETMHDDIETNAIMVYQDFLESQPKKKGYT